MATPILIALIITCILLISSILLQQMGSGLGGSFGGTGTSYQTKRGLEKILIYLSAVLGFIMSVLSLSYLII
jgi:protein translocase SecG subunit